MNAEIKGDKMIVTIDLTSTPVQSKSALEKAAKKGLKPETVPCTLVATSGGFIRCGNFKFSGNVTLAS